MTPALRWAAMRTILMFHSCEGQSHKTVSTDNNLWRERRAEADLNWGPSAYQHNALPLGQTGSLNFILHYPLSISLSTWPSKKKGGTGAVNPYINTQSISHPITLNMITDTYTLDPYTRQMWCKTASFTILCHKRYYCVLLSGILIQNKPNKGKLCTSGYWMQSSVRLRVKSLAKLCPHKIDQFTHSSF